MLRTFYKFLLGSNQLRDKASKKGIANGSMGSKWNYQAKPYPFHSQG